MQGLEKWGVYHFFLNAPMLLKSYNKNRHYLDVFNLCFTWIFTNYFIQGHCLLSVLKNIFPSKLLKRLYYRSVNLVCSISSKKGHLLYQTLKVGNHRLSFIIYLLSVNAK